MNTTLDILAIMAHPDDAEIGAAGTLLKHAAMGQRTGIIDLTRGELGTRGNAQTRAEEAAAASALLGLSVRENLELPDGFFVYDRTTIELVVNRIRAHRPRIVLCNTPSDRHPDHGRAAQIVADACYYSGLSKVKTTANGVTQEPWRPVAVYHTIQDYYHKPHFVVDISALWEKKLEVLRCFKTQFYNPASAEPETPISRANFFEFLKGRAIDFGRPAGFDFAEGFLTARTAGVENLNALL